MRVRCSIQCTMKGRRKKLISVRDFPGVSRHDQQLSHTACVCVQLEVQDRVSMLADLDEQIAEMHKRLEKQLMQQLETQELLRYMPSFVWE